MHLSEAVKTSGDRTSGLDLLKEALRNFHGHGPLLRSWAATLLNINLCNIHFVLYLKCLFYIAPVDLTSSMKQSEILPVEVHG